MRVAVYDGTDLEYFATDHLGSTVLVMDDTGSKLSEQRYLPFGEVRTDVGTPITQTDFGYTGQRNNTYIKLIDYGARWYSSSLGRFTQPDSIVPDLSNTQSWNRYSYVNNNPIIYNDPSGHRYCDWDGNGCEDHGDDGLYGSVYDWDPRTWSYGGGGNGAQPGNIENDIGDSENDESINISVGGTDYQVYVDWEGLLSDTDFWIDVIGLAGDLIPVLQPFSTGLEILTVFEFGSAAVTSWSTTQFVGQNGRKIGPFREPLTPTEERNVVLDIISIVPELGAIGSFLGIINNAANYIDIQVST